MPTVVRGYRELMLALNQADRRQKAETRSTFRQVGAVVQKDAAQRIAPLNRRTAAGYKVGVTTRGVDVYQSLKATSDPKKRRPHWGGLQLAIAMRPALKANEDRVMSELDHAFDRVADQFNRGGP